MVRVISGTTMAVVFVGVLAYGSADEFALLWSAVILVGLMEYAKLVRSAGIPVSYAPIMLGGVGLLAGLAYANILIFVLGLFLAVFLAGLDAIMQASKRQNAFTAVPYAVFGAVYVTVPLYFLILLRILPSGAEHIFVLGVATWMGDTGAYYAGRNFGKTKLAPAVSPGKTVEGLLGGLAAGFVFAMLAKTFLFPDITYLDCIGAIIAAGIFGPIGDLTESALKRSLNAKDSGSIIPGHGGVLDRLDSIMFSAPVYYMYLWTVPGIATG